MILKFLSRLLNLWTSSTCKLDDLKVSDRLVQGLSISEQTKQFVFAIHEPESQSVIYILAAQNLSKQAAADAECLIKEVRPEAVVAQVAPSALVEILSEERKSRDELVNSMPTTFFEVLKGCIVDKINKEMYENVAGNLVLREIFGIGFHGHFLAAKRAAEEVGSSFFLFESPFVNVEGSPHDETDILNKFQALVQQRCGLVPRKAGSVSPKRFCLTNDLQSQMVESLSTYLAESAPNSAPPSVSDVGIEDFQPRCNYQAPPFAQSIYPLLTDLHKIFVDIPSIEWALAYAQKMLFDVDRGEPVNGQLLSEVQTFQIAVEGLRIALNNASRCPISKMELSSSARMEFSELPADDKYHILLAQALRSETKNSKSIVAIVEAGSLAGLRKHWKTPVSWEVEDLVKQFFTKCEGEEQGLASHKADTNKLLIEKPLVAVGAGATAVLGASSIPKVSAISTFMKMLTLKVPVSLKLFLTYGQKAATISMGKFLGPSKVVAHGIASYGAKTTSVLKAADSAQKIRAVAHSVIVSAEQKSFSIMRTAFYEIMRKRRVQPIGSMLWVTLGCSLTMCTGLFMYGDGIECAAESLPSAPSIACLGRGIRSLRRASQEVTQANSSNIQETV
ncbi:hypothetical protein L1049_016894 [Liquidambar formosana]|uniref:Transmembrane protein n=1 Tax=Liquidambar formosana TaxID=63359 RepID=A0AAP0S6R1_LIQFO